MCATQSDSTNSMKCMDRVLRSQQCSQHSTQCTPSSQQIAFRRSPLFHAQGCSLTTACSLSVALLTIALLRSHPKSIVLLTYIMLCRLNAQHSTSTAHALQSRRPHSTVCACVMCGCDKTYKNKTLIRLLQSMTVSDESLPKPSLIEKRQLTRDQFDKMANNWQTSLPFTFKTFQTSHSL